MFACSFLNAYKSEDTGDSDVDGYSVATDNKNEHATNWSFFLCARNEDELKTGLLKMTHMKITDHQNCRT